MKKSKFTGQQIAFALKQAESGTPIDDMDRNRRAFFSRGNRSS